MSKKVSEIQEDFNKKSTTITSALGSGELDASDISVAGIGSFSESYTVYNDGNATDVVTVTKYTFNDTTYNTQEEAISARNREIDAKKGIVRERMAKCDSYKDELDTINKDCVDSINVLRSDVEAVRALERKI